MTGSAVTPAVWGIYVSLVPLGIGIALQYPGLPALTLNRVSDDERPRAVSTFTMFVDILTGCGGQFVGGIAAAVGGYRSAFVGVAMCSLVALLILRFLVLVRPAEETLPDPEVVVLREELSEK